MTSSDFLVRSLTPSIASFLGSASARLPVKFTAACLLLAVTLVAGATSAQAQSKTATAATIAVTSGGAAVSTVVSGTVVTLTASVKAGATALTTGQVNFCDATAAHCTDIHLLGTAQLTSAGTATLKFRPGIGSHSYKAVFVGTKSNAGSASSASALTVTGKISTNTAIAQSGTAGNYTLTATVSSSGNVAGQAAPTGTISFLNTTNGNAVLGTAALGEGTSGLSFLTSQNPATAYGPASIAVGDFNGDGIPDMAVAIDSYTGSVTILLGKGDGTFTATATSLSTGSDPRQIAAVDFNGDGILDLATADFYGNSITILLGNGDGTFKAPATITSVGQSPQFLVVADFNGDGIPDLAVTNQASKLIILLGNGDGTFTPTATSPATGTYGSLPVAVGDFNDDGIPDLALANGSSLMILLGNGDGTFKSAKLSSVLGNVPNGIAIGDFNRDGILDLAVTDDGYTGTVTILLGKGDGTFTPAANSPLSAGFYPQSVAVGDFNGDGIPDLAVGNDIAVGTVRIFVGNGDGTFIVPPSSPVLVGRQPVSAVIGDFNGDGVSDVAIADGDDSMVSILLAQSSEATASISSVAPAGGGAQLVEASYPGDSKYTSSTSGTTSLMTLVAAPVILPASGTYTTAQTITITDATPGATIYYSATGGSTATFGFIPYTGPIPMLGSGSLSIQAYATETGSVDSAYTSVSYVLDFPAAATPVISLASGLYPSAQTVTISDTTPGATIYYTTNGTYPGILSSRYSGPITVSTSEILVTAAVAPGFAWSGYATAQYDIASASTSFIYTIAGSDTTGYSGDVGPATYAEMSGVSSVAVDGAGNVYVLDSANNNVRKVAVSTGIITTIAGTGVAGHTGDNGPAASAELWSPNSIAADAAGNVFISEMSDSVVRRIDAVTGTITTIAGNPTGTGSLGGPANQYRLSSIVALATDPSGDLYIAANDEVLKVDSTGNIAGTVNSNAGNTYFSISGIAVDSRKNIYFSDPGYSVVRKIDPYGNTTIFAGSLQGGTSSDGGLATRAHLYFPNGLAADGAGNVYIADNFDYAIRKVDTNGIITTIAGVLSDPYVIGGDGSPATNVSLYPLYIGADSVGNVYFADQATSRIREITAPAAPPSAAAAAPVFSLAAGTYPSSLTLTMTDATPGAEIYVSLDGSAPSTSGQGYHGPITITGTVTVQAIALAPGYLASAPVKATYTITAPPTALISTVAGSGNGGMLGMGGPAASAWLGRPQAIAFDQSGNLYIADQSNSVVWMVASATGNISVVAGTGVSGNGIDGGLATETEMYGPSGLAFDKAGNLYIADAYNGRIRMVAVQTGIITTVAGPGTFGTLGDGGPATAAYLGNIGGLAFDGAGNLYVAGYRNNRIRMIAAKTGIISTVAGGGTAGTLGDGGLATAAYLQYPVDVALDGAGNLYIADADSADIRKVDAVTGIITTIAGNGIWGNTGDGGLASKAQISPQQGIAVDGAANVYFSDLEHRTRKVDAKTGILTTVAGDSYFGYAGDGGSAMMAGLNWPEGLALDAAGNLYIADSSNYVVRKVTFPSPASAPTFSPAEGTYVGRQTVTIADSIQGATIYYTADGSTPTTASTVYGGAVSVPASETLQAIAVASGYTQSTVATAAYTINLPVTPAITWPTPAPITYGTPLGATQLNATASVPGTFTYSPAAGTVLKAGSQTLSASFTPTDAIDYSTATSTVTLVVSKATPSVTWPTPSPISYGTALGAAQLDATSTVAGTFVYVPAAGTVLTGGSQSLSASFAPTDSTDYSTAAAAVTLVVNKGTPSVTLTPSSASIATVQPETVTVSLGGAPGGSTPTGSVKLTSGSYSAQQTLVSGSTAFNLAAGTLPVGTDTLVATYTPDASSTVSYLTATQSTGVTVTAAIGTLPATVTITPSAATITNEQAETVAVSVAGASGQSIPTGVATLTSGALTVQQTLANGSASFSIAAGALSSGSNTLTVSYSGDSTYASQVATASVAVSPALIVPPPPTSVAPGSSTTGTVTLTAGSTYSGTMNLTCSLTNSPAGAQSLPTCTLNPATVTLVPGGSGSTVLTVKTSAASTAHLARPIREMLFGGGGTALAMLLMFGIPARRRRWASMLTLLLILASWTVGCGGGSTSTASITPTTPATTAGSYTFVLTGTDTANTKTTTSANVTITVQ
jgi:sugar lactone lactonase YvrE